MEIKRVVKEEVKRKGKVQAVKRMMAKQGSIKLLGKKKRFFQHFLSSQHFFKVNDKITNNEI